MLIWVVPAEFLRDKPPELVAWTVGVVIFVKVTSVPLVIATLAGKVTNTSLDPAPKLTLDPVEDEITVSRLNVPA